MMIIFSRMTMCSSIFLLMGTAVERYLAVCRPHHYRSVRMNKQKIIIRVSWSRILGKPIYNIDWQLVCIIDHHNRSQRRRKKILNIDQKAWEKIIINIDQKVWEKSINNDDLDCWSTVHKLWSTISRWFTNLFIWCGNLVKRGQCPISDIVKDYQWVRWNAIKSNSYIALQSAHHRMKDDDEDEEWHV